jgi:acetyltransferase-like isoleucine patch superfamily enzyme
MSNPRSLSWDWHPGVIPDNVEVDDAAYIETTYSFLLFRSEMARAVVLGRGASVYLGSMFDVGRQGRVTVGECALVNGARIVCDSEINIGDYCLISWNVVLMDSYRVPFDRRARRRELEKVPAGRLQLAGADVPARPISIGNNVWIGFDVCVLPGVTIGEASVVGAKSVVTEDVPPCSLVAGNPARVIRRLDER